MQIIQSLQYLSRVDLDHAFLEVPVFPEQHIDASSLDDFQEDVEDLFLLIVMIPNVRNNILVSQMTQDEVLVLQRGQSLLRVKVELTSTTSPSSFFRLKLSTGTCLTAICVPQRTPFS